MLKKQKKYVKITFKLSNKEMQQLIKYSKTHKITINKLIKNALRTVLKNGLNNEIYNQEVINKNQLTIFDIIGETEEEC